LDFEVSAVKLFVMVTTQTLQFTKPKRCHVAAVILDVVDDFGGHDAALGFAHRA